MKNSKKTLTAVTAQLTAVVFLTLPTMASAKMMVDLGTLGGSYSRANGVNENGVVVGVAETTDSGHGFIYKPWVGHMTDLGTLGGFFSAAFAINNNGIVVGTSTLQSSDLCSRPVFWDSNNNNRITALPELPSNPNLPCSEAKAINDNNVIVGHSAGKAVRWVGSKIETLYSINGETCSSQSINRDGAVLIQCNGMISRGFVWKNG